MFAFKSHYVAYSGFSAHEILRECRRSDNSKLLTRPKGL